MSLAFQPLEPRRSSDRVADAIRRTILDGRFEAGTVLPPERTLASRFRVTRNTVREALRKLEQLRLVSIRQGSGVRVHDWLSSAGVELLADLVGEADDTSAGLLLDILEARSVIGGAMFARALERCDPARVVEVRAAAEAFARAASDGTEVRELQRLELEIHNRLLRASGNRAFVLLHNSMRHIYERVAHLFEAVVADPERLAKRYLAVVEALERREPQAAARAFQEIFDSVLPPPEEE